MQFQSRNNIVCCTAIQSAVGTFQDIECVLPFDKLRAFDFAVSVTHALIVLWSTTMSERNDSAASRMVEMRGVEPLSEMLTSSFGHRLSKFDFWSKQFIKICKSKLPSSPEILVMIEGLNITVSYRNITP